MMTPMPAVPDETTKAFTYSTPAETPTPTSALPLDKWRDLSDKLHGTGPQNFVKKSWYKLKIVIMLISQPCSQNNRIRILIRDKTPR